MWVQPTSVSALFTKCTHGVAAPSAVAAAQAGALNYVMSALQDVSRTLNLALTLTQRTRPDAAVAGQAAPNASPLPLQQVLPLLSRHPLQRIRST